MIPADELKRYLGLGPEDDVDSELLEQLEREELALFEARTNRYFGPVTELVETLSVTGRRLGLSHYGDPARRGSTLLRLRAPIVSLTSVELYGSGALISGAGWTAPWALSAFEIDGHRVTLVDGSVFPYGSRHVRVTYQGGYAEGEEPADVRGALMQRVLSRYRERHAVTDSQPPAALLTNTADRVEAVWRRNPGL